MNKSNFSYQDFKNFMKRYQTESKHCFVKVKNTSPYKYKKVFNKDHAHEFKKTSGTSS